MALTFFGANGTQLWLTDGSSGGTHLVTDMGVQFLTYINTVNGVAFFTVETGGMIQVWRSDGTAAGTFAVSGDLNALVNPQDTAVLDGQLYFVASDMVHGSGLYRTGGAAGDAEFLASARPGNGLPPLIATASQVFYFGIDSNGVELWATDGTQAGTVRLSDTQYEPQGDLVRFGESVVFLPFVGSPSPQPGPWISDGTLAGTHALFPGVTTPFSSYSIREANGLIYAVTSQFNPELGRSIDTLYSSSGEVGAVPATITLPGNLMSLAVLGGSLYAVSYTNSGPQIGRVDGTSYTPIQDFGSGGTSTAFSIGDRLLLLVLGPSGYGYYSFDGTSTHFVIGGFDPSSLHDFTVVDGTLYFVLNTGANSFLMVDDGTHPTHAIYATAQGNLSQVADIHAAPGGVIFSAFRADVGQELFFTNGTGISATLLNELAPGLDHSTSASIGWTGALPDGRYLFAYDDLTHGQEPWVSNGTVGGTQLLQDLAPGVAHSMLTAPMVFGGWTYFAAQNASLLHLFATNGTTTVDLGAASGNFFNNAVEYSGKLYFFFGSDVLAISPAAGTPAATDVARIAAPGSNWFTSEALVDGKLLVSSFDGVWSFNGTTFTRLASGFGGGEVVGNGTVAYFVNAQSLYQTDGTVAGTINLFTNPIGFPPQWLELLPNGNLIFSDPFGSSLWVRDGTGVHELADFNTAGWDSVSRVTISGNQFYFTAQNSSGQTALWVSDGTGANTHTIDTSAVGTLLGADLGVALNGGAIMVLGTELGRAVIWINGGTGAVTLLGVGLDEVGQPVADGAGHAFLLTNTGLFITDGTVAGTQLLMLSGSAGTGEMVGGYFYFTTTSGADGTELWRSDGTVAGTVMLTDTAEQASSNPEGFGTATNHAPEAVADHAAVNAGATVAASSRANGVLGNDADPDLPNNALLTVTGVRAGAGSNNTVPNGGSVVLTGTYGTLTLAADGTWSYAATASAATSLGTGVQATDVFSYTVADNLGATRVATLSIQVTGTGLQFIGTPNNDVLTIGAGNDGATVDGLAGTDQLAVTGSVNLTGGSLNGIEAVSLSGGANLTLTGTQFANGLAPNSALSGTGSITVNMVAGTSFFATLMTSAPGSNVTFTINGSADVDVIKGALGSVSTLSGGGNVDQIRGGNLADVINGGDGNDKIIGLGGADQLTGGAGADQFRYLFTNDSGVGAGNRDVILDFSAGEDKLDFRALDANPVLAGRQTLSFIGTGAFTSGGVGEARYAVSGADLLVQIDLDGNGTTDMEMLLQGAGAQTLTGTDFLF